MAAKPLDNFKDMGSEKDRHASLRHSPEQCFKSTGRQRIHSLEWLVQKQYAGSVNHRGRQRQLFLHAVRIIRDHGLWAIRELHELQQLLRTALRSGPVETVHTSNEMKIFGTGQAFEKAHAFRHHSDLALHLNWIGSEIDPKKLHAPRSGGQQSGQHLNGG